MEEKTKIQKAIEDVEAKISYMKEKLALEGKYEMQHIASYDTTMKLAEEIGQEERWLAVLKYWNEFNHGEDRYNISKYICLYVGGSYIQITLRDEIMSELYKKVCDSWSTLYEEFIKRFIPLISPVTDENGWFSKSFSIEWALKLYENIHSSHSYDNKLRKNSNYFLDEFKLLVSKLTSEELKPFIDIAECYIDKLIELADKNDN